MTQTDWVGNESSPGKFKDIQNLRPSVAEEKARLAMELGALINRVPASVASGSIDVVRLWKSRREEAYKVAKKKRSSVNELESAITGMRGFK